MAMAGAGVDLISGEAVGLAAVELEPLVPVLVELDAG